MRAHIDADEPFERSELPVAEAVERFRDAGEPYKVELIEDLERDQGAETVSLYRNGPFTDLCRDRTRRPRAGSAPSSSTRSPAPTGAATRAARC